MPHRLVGNGGNLRELPRGYTCNVTYLCFIKSKSCERSDTSTRRGPGAQHLGSSRDRLCKRGIYCTITVVSLTSQAAKAIAIPLDELEPTKRVSRAAFTHLDNVAKERILKQLISKFTLRPLSFRLGEFYAASRVRLFTNWKQIMTVGTYSFKLKCLTRFLLRAQVCSFESGHMAGPVRWKGQNLPQGSSCAGYR